MIPHGLLHLGFAHLRRASDKQRGAGHVGLDGPQAAGQALGAITSYSLPSEPKGPVFHMR